MTDLEFIKYITVNFDKNSNIKWLDICLREEKKKARYLQKIKSLKDLS